MSDIDTVVMDSLKALDPNRPIREADIGWPPRHTFQWTLVVFPCPWAVSHPL
ncbi:MAG: hypothetical protein WA322_26225 [Pseudolabrys sp.]